MNFDGLCDLIRALDDHGIGIDYIETNASWCIRDDLVRDRLKILKSLGVQTVMASVDPFHIEYVPLERPLRLCRILGEMEMDYFIWQDRFLERLLPLDLKKTHTKEELSALLGENYIEDTAREYGVKVNGVDLTERLVAGETYTANVSAFASYIPEGKAIDTITVTMGGNPVENAYDAISGTVTVPNVNGDLVVTITFKDAEPGTST